MVKLLLCFVLLVTFIGPGRGSAANSVYITQFPFKKYLGGIIIIQAQLQPYKDTLNFVLDTGSGGISLDSITCNRLQVLNRLTDTFLTGVGGRKQLRFSFNNTLSFPGLKVDSLNFHINDYSLLSDLYNVKIDGVIGYSLLKRFVVLVDYENAVVKLYSKGNYNYPENGYLIKDTIRYIPETNALVEDERVILGRFYFDSGADMELLLSKDLIDDVSFFNAQKKKLPVNVEGAIGQQNMKVAVMKRFKLGPYKFKKVPVYFFDDNGLIFKTPKPIGLIGNGIIKKFNLILNYGQGEIFLQPNRLFNESFDYAYTGLNLRYREDRVEVNDVAEDSPAAKAGLQAGDELIGIGNAFSNDLQHYRKALACPNCNVVLFVKRGDSFQRVLLKIKSIL